MRQRATQSREDTDGPGGGRGEGLGHQVRELSQFWELVCFVRSPYEQERAYRLVAADGDAVNRERL